MIAKNLALIVISSSLLSGCQKQSVTGYREAQSLDFYSKNAEIAKIVANKCLDFESKELSKLPASEQRTWRDSTDGVNCTNAKTARSFQLLGEQQKRYHDAVKDLGNWNTEVFRDHRAKGGQ